MYLIGFYGTADKTNSRANKDKAVVWYKKEKLIVTTASTLFMVGIVFQLSRYLRDN